MQGGVNSSLNNLMKLSLQYCKKCLHLPSLSLLPNLQFLEIKFIEKVKSMGSKFYVDQSNNDDGVGLATQFPALREFRLARMDSLEEWVEVEGVTVFPCLERLSIENCPELKTWTMDGFSSNHKLSSLSISRCQKLMAIPSMDGLSSLKTLSIEECYKLMSLPSGLGSCTSLQELTISGCKKLSSIQSINGLTSLTSLRLSNCDKLMSLSSGLGSCTSLQELRISNCKKLSSIQSINGLTSLRTLELCNCDELTGLPIGLGSCTSLQSGTIWGCHNIISITKEIGELHSLSYLLISSCGKLRNIPEECVGRLTCLKRLQIGGFCSELEEFPGLTYIHQLHASLEVLELNGWDKLKSLPHQLQHLTALKELTLSNFNRLEALPEWLGDLSSLSNLEIWNCPNLTHLPSIEAMQRLSNLRYLHIVDCLKLKERCAKESGPEWAKISRIPNIRINFEHLQRQSEYESKG